MDSTGPAVPSSAAVAAVHRRLARPLALCSHLKSRGPDQTRGTLRIEYRSIKRPLVRIGATARPIAGAISASIDELVELMEPSRNGRAFE